MEELLHSGQHAYQRGKSVDTTLVEAVGFIDRGMENKGLVLAAFLDVEGSFNNTTEETTEMRKHAAPNIICKWIGIMLSCKRIEAARRAHSCVGTVDKGCSRGGGVCLLRCGA